MSRRRGSPWIRSTRWRRGGGRCGDRPALGARRRSATVRDRRVHRRCRRRRAGARRSSTLGDRQVVRVGLRAVLIKHETDLAAFDRAFDLVFADGAELPGDDRAGAPERAATVGPMAAPQLALDVSTAAAGGDLEAMRALAVRAVAMFAGDEASDGAITYRVLRALDVANMLSAAMRRLRDEGELSEFELGRAPPRDRPRPRGVPPRVGGGAGPPGRPAPSRRRRRAGSAGRRRRTARRPQRGRAARPAAGAAAAHPTAGGAGRATAPCDGHRPCGRAAHDAAVVAVGRHPDRPGAAPAAPAPSRRRRALRRVGFGRRVRPVHVHARPRPPRRARQRAQLRLRGGCRRDDRRVRRGRPRGARAADARASWRDRARRPQRLRGRVRPVRRRVPRTTRSGAARR